MNRRLRLGKASLVATLMCWAVGAAQGQETPGLPALTAAELSMKDNPAQPGAPAVILCYAVDTDNQKSTETHAVRIKIFRDEGKKYADVEIPYFEKYSEVLEVHARTIGSDGKVTPFEQQVFDREIVKTRKFGYHAKVFTLPNVQTGSILEYSYRMHYKEKVPDAFQHPTNYIFERGLTFPAADWPVQHNLYVLHGHFTLLPVRGARVEYFAQGMKAGGLPVDAEGRMTLDVENVPAFESEEYALPEEELKKKMMVYYSAGYYSPDAYWTGYGNESAKNYEKFIGVKRSKAIDAEVARLLAPTDDDELKLRKLYDRAQLIRFLSYEDEKTGKESKRQNLKENKSAQDVLERGYASANEANLLFIAMARAAGFAAEPVLVTSRRSALFKRNYPNAEQLDAMVVRAQAGGKTYVLDPATRYCPFGLLPWDETAAGGVLIEAGGSKVVSTPEPTSGEAVTRIDGTLQLDPSGTLKGSLRVSYVGRAALIQRLWGASVDETKRREELEESFQQRLPHGAVTKLKEANGWDKAASPLTLEYEVEVPNYAVAAGRRLILPVGVLHTTEKTPFPSSSRTSSIYFEYPYEDYEDIRLELPPGMQAESLPPEKNADRGQLKYNLSVKQDGNALEIKRSKLIQVVLVEVSQYARVRSYFDQVLMGDSQQVTLKGRAEGTQ